MFIRRILRIHDNVPQFPRWVNHENCTKWFLTKRNSKEKTFTNQFYLSRTYTAQNQRIISKFANLEIHLDLALKLPTKTRNTEHVTYLITQKKGKRIVIWYVGHLLINLVRGGTLKTLNWSLLEGLKFSKLVPLQKLV